MMVSRKQEYDLIDAPSQEEAYVHVPRVIDVAYEQQCFSDNSISITEMAWNYDYCGIAVFDYGYFGDTYNYQGRGGYGEGSGGGYKVAGSKNSVNPTPTPFQGGAG